MRITIKHPLKPDITTRNFGHGYFSFKELKMIEENKFIMTFETNGFRHVYLINYLGQCHLTINSSAHYFNIKMFFKSFQLI